MDQRLYKLFTSDNTIKFTHQDFETMWNIDKNQFCTILFYLRSHRSKIHVSENGDLFELTGPGYRQTWYQALIWMSLYRLRELLILLPHIPDYGYWKDLLVLVGTPAEHAVISLFATQLTKDYISYKKDGRISMAAKWVPNENSSNDKLHRTFGKIAEKLGVSKRTLRKQYVVPLRIYLGVTEQLTSAKLWHKVDYNIVPKLSLLHHNNEFLNHDNIRYNMFLNHIHTPYADTYYVPNKTRENILMRNKTLLVIDIAPSMLGLPLLVAQRLAENIAWIPYRLEKESVINLDVSVYNHVPDIERDNSISYNLVDSVMIAKQHGIEHLIIITNLLLDDAEYVVERDKMHITYWAVSKNRLTIQSYPKYTLVDGYDVNIFNMIKDGSIVTKEEYINKIYGLIKEDHQLPLI